MIDFIIRTVLDYFSLGCAILCAAIVFGSTAKPKGDS